jgi:hypothetical protein
MGTPQSGSKPPSEMRGWLDGEMAKPTVIDRWIHGHMVTGQPNVERCIFEPL